VSETDAMRANFAYFTHQLARLTLFWIAVNDKKWTSAYDVLREVLPDLKYERVTHIDFIAKKRAG
jgi:hypothetical protein